MGDSIKRTVADLGRKLGYEIKRWRNPPQAQIDRNDPALSATAFLRQRQIVSRTIFDVGANVGDYCQSVLPLFPEATVWCFEPTPDVYQQLQKRFAGNSRVRTFENAVAQADGPIQFHIRSDSVWNSVLDNGASGITPQAMRQVHVEGVSLDSFTEHQSLQNIDLLKLDIQGAELLALRGAESLLAEGRIALIQLEINFQQLYSGQADLEMLSRFLFGHGYWFQGIYGASQSSGLLLAADLIYAHKRFS